MIDFNRVVPRVLSYDSDSKLSLAFCVRPHPHLPISLFKFISILNNCDMPDQVYVMFANALHAELYDPTEGP